MHYYCELCMERSTPFSSENAPQKRAQSRTLHQEASVCGPVTSRRAPEPRGSEKQRAWDTLPFLVLLSPPHQ